MYAACLPQILVRTADQRPHYAQGCCHAVLSWPGLVKQVLPSMDSCWLASADGAVASLSQGEGRTALQTIVLPRICSSSNSSSSSSSGAARSSPCSGAARAARSRRSSLAAHCSSSSNNQQRSSQKRGSLQQQQQQQQQRTKGQYRDTVHCKN